MNFKVDPETVMTGELLEAEGNIRLMSHLMKRYVVDASGEPVPPDEAYKQLMALSFADHSRAQEDFLAGLFRENAKLLNWVR